jgi:hypothetical protein
VNIIQAETKIQRVHVMTLLPTAILLVLIAWQLMSYAHYSGLMPETRQITFLALIFIMSIAALFFRDASSGFLRYIEGIVDHMRAFIIGMSCILMGGIHFISILGNEPIYFQMIYVILIIAYFETASIAMDYRSHYVNGMISDTRATMLHLLAGISGRLAMVLVLSVTMLYLSLLVVVGFTGPFSVAFLGAIMILAIVFMTLVRRL